MADEIKAVVQDPNYVAPAMNGHAPNGGNGRNGHHAPNGNGAKPGAAPPIVVELDARRDTLSAIEQLRLAATDHPGKRPLHLRVKTEDGRIVTMEAGGRYRVSDDFLSASGIELWVV